MTYLIRRGDTELVLRRPPRPPLPPSAHDVLREARLLGAVEDADVRTPKVLVACDDESVIGAPFYVMERVSGDVIVTALPEALDSRGAAPPHLRGARRLPDRDPRRRLGGLRPAGLRQADRLPRPPAAALRRPVGAQQDARAAAARRPGRVAGGAQAGVRPRHDRPRRLPARQRDVRPGHAAAAERDLRLGAGHDRRPARGCRLPRRHLGGAGRAGQRDLGARRAHAPARLPPPRRPDRPLRGALGPLDVRRPLVHDARAVEVGDLPRGLLQAPARGHDRGPVLRSPQAGRARRGRPRVADTRRAE